MWISSDLWACRTLAYGGVFQSLHLRIRLVVAVTVYLNSQKIADLDGWVVGYWFVKLGEKARQALRQGQNMLSIHVHQNDGGQYLNAGLVDVVKQRDASESNEQ